MLRDFSRCRRQRCLIALQMLILQQWSVRRLLPASAASSSSLTMSPMIWIRSLVLVGRVDSEADLVGGAEPAASPSSRRICSTSLVCEFSHIRSRNQRERENPLTPLQSGQRSPRGVFAWLGRARSVLPRLFRAFLCATRRTSYMSAHTRRRLALAAARVRAHFAACSTWERKWARRGAERRIHSCSTWWRETCMVWAYVSRTGRGRLLRGKD